jgi:hypothetical protein
MRPMQSWLTNLWNWVKRMFHSGDRIRQLCLSNLAKLSSRTTSRWIIALVDQPMILRENRSMSAGNGHKQE